MTFILPEIIFLCIQDKEKNVINLCCGQLCVQNEVQGTQMLYTCMNIEIIVISTITIVRIK